MPESTSWSWLGPVLLFIAAMVTLIVTTTSANKRELKKWQRDTLIRLCSDAVDAAREVERKCESGLNQKRDILAKGQFAAAAKAASGIETISERLYLMNMNNLADTCVRMKSAAQEVLARGSHLRAARRSTADRQRQELAGFIPEEPGWSTELTAPRVDLGASEQDIRDRIHAEMEAPHEEGYASARKELESQLLAFLRCGRKVLS